MRLPAEWEQQSGTWLSWPARETHWDHLAPDAMQRKWAEIASAISQSQMVFLNTHEEMEGSVRLMIRELGGNMSNISLFAHPNDDVWCRDHGAIFIEDQGEIMATDWRFNGWGERFSPWELDDNVASQMAKSQGLACRTYAEVLEGGAIESNGQGTIMTTEAVLLNPNRNPHLDKAGVEAMLQERLGADHVIWLKDGIVGDDTGGHIDDIARFVNTDTILISQDDSGPNRDTLAENRRLLQEQSGASIIDLPMPSACEIPGWRLPTLPASYVNFLITNETVLVPTFRQKKNDNAAMGVIAEHFPARDVIGIDALDIVAEGGAIHCISMQQPLARLGE